MQSGPLYWVVRFSTFPYANLECKHHPDGVCMFTPLVEDWLGLLLAPCIGSNIDSKSEYIVNGTLNWCWPFEYSTIGFLVGISILTDSLDLQHA